MDVEGDIITFAECNGIANSYPGECAVAWGVQTCISWGTCYSHSFLYRLCAPEGIYNDIHNNGSYYSVSGTNVSGTGRITLNQGTTMVFHALFADGEGAKNYKCMIKKTTDSQWSIVKDYSSVSTFTITNNSVGSYAVKLIGRDRNKHSDNVNFFFDVISQPLKNNGTYIEQKGTGKRSSGNMNVLKDSTLTVKPVFGGGYGNIRYKYMWKKTTDSSWTVLQDYSAKADSMEIKAPDIGEYVVKVIARDARSNAASTDIRYRVESGLKNNGSTAVCDYTSISGTSFSVIQKVPVTYQAKFSGAIGDVQYQFQFRKANALKWTTAQKYSTRSQYSLILSGVGTYYVRITAKDSTGKTATAEFTEVVKRARIKDKGTFVDYRGDSFTGVSMKVAVGQEFTINPIFANDGYDYQLTAEYKVVGQGGFVRMEEPFDYRFEIPLLHCCFEEAGRYTIRITAKDDYGNTAVRSFTFNAE